MFIYKKLPRKVRRFLEKHSLLTDLATLIAVYMLLGGTLAALVAGAMCGIMVSIMLHIANNPDDFLYLYDLKDYVSEKLAELKVTLNDYGAVYRQRKIEKAQKTEVYAQ
jgi:hypothetical protein